MIGNRSRHIRASLYQWTVIVAGGLAMALRPPQGLHELPTLATLLVLFALAEYFPIRVRVGGVSFSFPIAYIAFIIFGPADAAWVAGVGTMVANVARRRNWPVTLFNGMQLFLAALCAGHLSLLWPGPPSMTRYLLPLLVNLVIYYVINNVMVDILLWQRLKVYSYADWMAKNRYACLSAGVSLTYAVLMWALAPYGYGHAPDVLIFFFLPLVAVGAITRLFTNLMRHVRQTEMLLEVSTLVTAEPDESLALTTALARLDSFLEYRYAVIYQTVETKLVARAVLGIAPTDLVHAHIPLGEGISGWSAKAAQPVFAPGAQDERNTIGEGVQEGAGTLVAVPLVSSGQVMGVLTVGLERTHSLPPEDQRLLSIFANLLAAIMRNLELAEERQRLLLFQERNRFARDIHDGLAQGLAGVILQLDRLERLMETDVRGAMKLMQFIRGYLRESLLDVRRSIYNLRPSPLELHSLVESLRHEVDRLRQTIPTGGTEVRFEVRGDERRLSGLVEEEVFRIAQEGLSNAIKHATAAEIAVSLQFSADQLRLVIRDDGRGFRLADAVRSNKARAGYGLLGVTERAERLGASFDVDSSPNAGTRLTVDVPLMGE